MNKKEISTIFNEIGILLDLKGENPFKSRAYYNAARVIEGLSTDIALLIENGEIGNLKGIGKALAEKITTLVTTGSLPYYEQLKSGVPSGLLEMLKIPGMGIKKVKTIYEKLKISTIAELEYACLENRLRDLEGFGQKSQDKILENIKLHKKYSERFLYSVAEKEATSLLEYLQNNNKFIRIEVAGSLRRKNETVKDIDIVASSLPVDRETLMAYFVNYEHCKQIINQGETKSSILLLSGINADLRIVDDDVFPFTLHHFTGSKEHNTELRSIAKIHHMKMNEYGIFKGKKRIECADESEIFGTLGMKYIPPELRENMGEIEAAQKDELPDLYSGSPFYGLLHVHTSYSDGANNLTEIAEACQKMGFTYVGICDHSKSAFYANGLSEKKLKTQFDEIESLNKKMKNFTILKGIEVDILSDGSLDFENDILSECDFVIASVHSNFGLSEEAMTRRICNALKNPYVSILGHPTGRLLLGREPYSVNMEHVIKIAAKNGKAIEINSNPYRLDLDWRLGKVATTHSVKTALNPDAHSIEGLHDYRYGIGIARKGWFKTSAILNALSVADLKTYFKKQRKFSLDN